MGAKTKMAANAVSGARAKARRAVLALGIATASMTFSVAARADTFDVSVEAAGVQNTTEKLQYSGVETFNNVSATASGTSAGENFNYNLGTGSMPITIVASYANVNVIGADQYGGAGGTGQYAVTFTPTGYTVNLSATNNATGAAVPVNYFGVWLSAMDAGNELKFYNNNTLLYTFNESSLASMVGSCSSGTNAYCGNPTNPWHEDSTEAFAFVNFSDTTSSGFNKIVFSETPQVGGFESDNQTYGYNAAAVTSVPEPGQMALMALATLGLFWARRRTRAKAVLTLA